MVESGSIEEVVATCTQPLLRAALGLGFAQTDAEELVQETFVTYLNGKFEGRSSVKTYLFGILYHKGSELARRRRREQPTDDIEAAFDSRFDARGHWAAGSAPHGPEDAALTRETADIIARCAQMLGYQQRAAFYMKEVDRADSAQICEALEISDANLRVLLFRGRVKLRECLEKSWGKK